HLDVERIDELPNVVLGNTIMFFCLAHHATTHTTTTPSTVQTSELTSIRTSELCSSEPIAREAILPGNKKGHAMMSPGEANLRIGTVLRECSRQLMTGLAVKQ